MATSELDTRLEKLECELVQLRLQEQLAKQLSDKLNIGLITLKNGLISSLNQKALSFLEIDLNDLNGIPLANLCPIQQEDGRLSNEILDEAISFSTNATIEFKKWDFKSTSKKNIECGLLLSSVIANEDIYTQIEIVLQKIKEKDRKIEPSSEWHESLNEGTPASIYEKAEANNQLIRNELWNKSIVGNIPLGLTVINNNNIEYLNDALIKILGYPLEEIKVKIAADFAFEEKIHIDKDIQTSWKKGQPSNNLEFWVSTKAGQKKFIRNQYVKLNQEDRWMIITTDLTHEKNKESEAKETESALKESEEKFRTIIQHLTDIIIVVDEKVNVIYESPSVSKVFGYEPGYFTGKSGLEFIHPDDISLVKHEFEQVLRKTNDFRPTELRIRHQSGHWIYVELLGDNLLEYPSIGGILLTARDVTERKENIVQLSLYQDHLEHLVKQRTEEIEQMNCDLISINEELKATNEELNDKNEKLKEEISKRIEAQLLLEESENKFRSFIEQSTEGITLIDESGHIVDWNRAMETIFRVGREDIINTLVWEFDYRLLPDKRKTAEQFEELKNSVMDYLSNIDHTKVMTVEGTYFTIELKQKYLNVTIFPVITPKHKYVGRIFRDITGIRRAQEEIQKQSEDLLAINENLEIQKSELEKTLLELRKTQAQLVQSEKMASLGVLTAGVAHEINNPVNYINTALEGLKITIDDILQIFQKYEEIDLVNVENILPEIALLKKSLDYPLLREGIDVLILNMQTGIERITEIVKSLRTFARVEENELKISNVHELIDTTLIMLHNQYKNRIELVKNYGNIPPINCYPGKLSQVFMNILSNAMQSISNKGKVQINTKADYTKSLLIISIADDGLGIPEKIKEKIFEPFFTTKEAGKGTGLGLSITYGIIQQHNGNIEVKSEPGKGSEFIITLPLGLN
jgi:PAS domain S-box-containing protein